MIFLRSLQFAVVAGILAKKAVEAGLAVKSFIKTSLSPGSGVVTYYLKESGVLEFMEKLGLVATYCWSWLIIIIILIYPFLSYEVARAVFTYQFWGFWVDLAEFNFVYRA